LEKIELIPINEIILRMKS